jgi:hypothetical protein
MLWRGPSPTTGDTTMLEPNGNTIILKCPECHKVHKVVDMRTSQLCLPDLRRMDADYAESHVCQPRA